MNKSYNPSLPSSLHENKNAAEKKNALKGLMQIIFVLSFILLVVLAFAKAQGV
jgi:hypothetical protein